MTQLGQSLDTTRDSCLKLLYALDRAHVLHLLTTELKSYKKLVNPDKILLGNSNIMYAVGGAGKSFEQITDEPGSFLAVDETETGYGARIPLWLFGFLYLCTGTISLAYQADSHSTSTSSMLRVSGFMFIPKRTCGRCPNGKAGHSPCPQRNWKGDA